MEGESIISNELLASKQQPKTQPTAVDQAIISTTVLLRRSCWIQKEKYFPMLVWKNILSFLCRKPLPIAAQTYIRCECSYCKCSESDY